MSEEKFGSESIVYDGSLPSLSEVITNTVINCNSYKPGWTDIHIRIKLNDDLAVTLIDEIKIYTGLECEITGWQPIETAPKDKYVLVFSESYGVCVSFYTRGIDHESDVIRDGWFSPERDNRDERMVLDGTVTHWMPLPEPPK